MLKRLSLLLLSNLAVLLVASPAFASFHLMKIEEVIGGVGGATNQQAIQLRMRALGQNLVGSNQARLIARDAAGLNPVSLIVFPSDVLTDAQGSRILVVSSAFATAHPGLGDFIMTNVIPPSYLPAGRLTFEDSVGTVYWSLAWGGSAYTGPNAGSNFNDADGNFGSAFGSRLPSSANQALRFAAADATGGAASTNNLADYAVTPGPAVFTNNAGTSAALPLIVASITTVQIATGLASPVAITNAHDGSGRLFITLQDGRVMIHDGCVVLATPFLDIRTLVLSGGERGLLSIAFHPGFPATPYFYVYYTRQGDGAIVIARYRLSTNPNQADAASAAILKVIPHPGQSNHNGGQLQFGPDGYLYAGTGDGGSGDDPPCNAQNNATLLGRILRFDVNQNFNTAPFYGIPPTNPGTVGLPETWAKGMRNPWRFAFDRLTGDLLIGDVGQGAHEEVDFQPAGAVGGRNYGWKVMEGNSCTGTSTATCTIAPPACFSASYTAPVFDYAHASGRCSITGGYRYRGGQIPTLAGNYVYADYCTGEIFQATNSGAVWTSSAPFLSGNAISTFGEDEAGELYFAHISAGNVYRIVGAGPLQANLSVTKTDGQTTAIAGQPVTYTIAVGNAGPVTASAATVMDTFPAALQNVDWTCSATAGSSCCSIVGGNTLINRPVTVLPGGTVTYTATATISSAATGTLSNTATVTAPAGVTDPNLTNNSATDVDTLTAQADLSITKTDGQATALPGAPITYTIVASNTGPSVATGATVADTLPAVITGVTWTCVGAGGGTCTGSGSGNINSMVNLPVGGSVTYTVTGTVSSLATGSLSNTATVTAPVGVTDPNPGNNSATDTDTVVPTANLSITKTDGQTTAVPGMPVTYTIVASNAGPSPVTGATVADTLPATITGATWTCVGAGGGACTASGSGNINSMVNLPVGGSVTYMLTGTISASATGSLANTATVAAPGGVTDPNPANNSATDTDILPGVNYFTLASCRVADTRGGAPIGGPVLQGQQTRVFAVAGHCGIPSTAKAISINLTVAQSTAAGNLVLFPAGQPVPTVSTINYLAGQTRANNAIVELDLTGQMAAFVSQTAGTTVHLILDVNGYFE